MQLKYPVCECQLHAVTHRNNIAWNKWKYSPSHCGVQCIHESKNSRQSLQLDQQNRRDRLELSHTKLLISTNIENMHIYDLFLKIHEARWLSCRELFHGDSKGLPWSFNAFAFRGRSEYTEYNIYKDCFHAATDPFRSETLSTWSSKFTVT